MFWTSSTDVHTVIGWKIDSRDDTATPASPSSTASTTQRTRWGTRGRRWHTRFGSRTTSRFSRDCMGSFLRGRGVLIDSPVAGILKHRCGHHRVCHHHGRRQLRVWVLRELLQVKHVTTTQLNLYTCMSHMSSNIFNKRVLLYINIC